MKDVDDDVDDIDRDSNNAIVRAIQLNNHNQLLIDCKSNQTQGNVTFSSEGKTGVKNFCRWNLNFSTTFWLIKTAFFW